MKNTDLNQGMCTVVTGCSGFLGKAICEKLHSAGERVLGIDILSPGAVEWAFIQMDIRSIPENFLENYCIKTVYHCAALVPLSPRKSEYYSVNSVGALTSYQWSCRRQAEIFIYISSSAVYGADHPHMPLLEESKLRPFENYGKTKLQGEQLLKKERLEQVTKLSIVRPRTILGPSRLGIFSLLFYWISKDQPVWILGNGKSLIQFVHIDDVVELLLKIANKRLEGVFLCGGNDVSSIEDCISELIQSARSRSRILKLPVFIFEPILRLFSALGLLAFTKWHYRALNHNFYFGLDKTKSITGWSPRYSNKEILFDAYIDFLKNKKLNNQNSKSSLHLKNIDFFLLKIYNNIMKAFR